MDRIQRPLIEKDLRQKLLFLTGPARREWPEREKSLSGPGAGQAESTAMNCPQAAGSKHRSPPFLIWPQFFQEKNWTLLIGI